MASTTHTMHLRLISIASASLIWLCAARAEVNQPAIPPERVSVYQVPLVCPAAPQIGCGSRAKPILLSLESEKPVAEAWINRRGTLLAIVWKPDTKRKERTAAFNELCKKEELEARELTGRARKKVLQEFLSRTDWLRGSEVDRLSEEEAGIMAGRLVRKIRSVIELTEGKAALLQGKLAEIINRRLIGLLADQSSVKTEVFELLRRHLSRDEVILLQEALKDYHPNRDEP